MKFSDEELIVMYASGAREAFDMIYERYRDRIYRFARTCLKDEGDAEDLVQDVFIRVSRAAPRYRPRGRFRSWIFQIAANRIRSDLSSRGKRPEGAPEMSEPDLIPSGENLEERVVARDLVRRFLSLLSKSQRMILLLKEVEGFDSKEIAAALGMTRENVRVHLHRSRMKLLTFLRRPKGEA